MSDACLTLTAYFGERDRTGARDRSGDRKRDRERDRLVADALLDLYGSERVQASILLRGVEGFGTMHHRHTDRLLSLSEDLPVVAIATDAPQRIESLVPRVLELKRRGLVTLERCQQLTDGRPNSVEGAAAKLTIQIGRQDRLGRAPAYIAICDLLQRRGLVGATALLGVDGTRAGRRARARMLSRNLDIPTLIVSVGPAEQIEAVVPDLQRMLDQPLLTLERVCICKRDGELLAQPPAIPGRDERGRALWQKLTVYSSQSTTYAGQSLHVELIRRLRETAAGATSVRGIWGFHGDHRPHGDRLLQLRRHVPVVTTVIDTPAAIARSFAIIDKLTAQRGLVTSELVPALAMVGDAGPDALRALVSA